MLMLILVQCNRDIWIHWRRLFSLDANWHYDMPVGVPQSSVIVPLLFSIYTSPISTTAQSQHVSQQAICRRKETVPGHVAC